MIRKLDNKDVNRIMEIWLESTIKAHSFIEKEYWQSNYNTVKETNTQEQETENIPKIELQASYRMDEHGNLVKVYEKEP